MSGFVTSNGGATLAVGESGIHDLVVGLRGADGHSVSITLGWAQAEALVQWLVTNGFLSDSGLEKAREDMRWMQ